MKKLVACILFAALLMSGQAYALTVEIKPQIIDIENATTFEVFIKDVADFGAFEFVLQYDPSLVTIESVAGGTFLGTTGRKVGELPENIDNVHGKLTYANFTTGTVAGPTGSGSIATVTFSLASQTDTVLSFDANRSYITDSKGNVLPVSNWIGATITNCICKVAASAGAGGKIEPSGELTELCNANKTFTITPDSCYNIADVVVDGVSVGAVSSYTLNCTGGNHTVVASFSPTPNYTVTVNLATGGTVTPAGPVSVPCGGTQKFEITPNRTSPDGCYRITDVLVDGASVGAVSSYEFKDVHSNHSIEAKFKLNSCKLEISAGSGGKITPTGVSSVICGQHFVITPDSGYSVKDVTVNGTSVGAVTSYDFSCGDEGVHKIYANFIGPDFWTIKASAGEHGSINPSGDVRVPKGGNQIFTITPDECYQIADVKIDGVSKGSIAIYTFENVTQNHEIVASFVIKKHTVTLKIGDKAPEITEVNCGEASPTFTITPDGCSKIADVKIGDTSVMEDVKVNDAGVGTYTLLNVKNDCTIDVSFSQNTEKTFTIEATSEGHGKITSDAEGSIVCGGSRKFTFTPDENAEIFEVRIDGKPDGDAKTNREYLFENVTANHTILVVFSPHIITAAAGEHGKIDPSGEATVAHGESKTFTVTPDASYKIADVRIDDRYSDMQRVTLDEESGVGTYTFEKVTEDHSINAVFACKCTTTVKGDINCDGVVDMEDAVLVLKVMSGSNDTVNLCADVNGDKKIGIEELIYILKAVVADSSEQ